MIKDRIILKTTLAAATFAAATTVLAQTTPQRPEQRNPSQTTPQRDRAMQDNRDVDSTKFEFRRASQIIGSDLHGTDDEDLGDISDLAINPQSGRVMFAVISTGGVMGIGAERTMVPIKALSFGGERQPARIAMNKTAFGQAPKLEDRNWDRLTDEDWNTTVNRHYNVHPDRHDWTTERHDQRDVAKDKADKADKMVGGKAPLVKATDVIGADVRNTTNENLGDINDLMVNLRNGQIAYAVLGFGGVLGVGEKLFAVPWQAVQYQRDDKRIVLNVEKDRLDDAPGFDRNNWPNMADANWSRDVHAFYGTDANWVYGFDDDDMPQGRTGAQPSTAGAGSRGWQADSEYNRMFRSGTTQTVTGTVRSTDRTRPMANMSEAYVLTVQTEQGQSMAVHLGPAWFIDHQNVRFNNNDRVTIVGAQVTVDGKPCLLAREVRTQNQTLTLRQQDGAPVWDAARPTSGSNANTNRDANSENRNR